MSCIFSLMYVLLGVTTTGPIFCVGNSLSQVLAGTQVRQLRSPHLLHRRMCPLGASRESCFYSQLSMFMKLHDSLTDPVSMRNIGKRSGGVADGTENGSSYPDLDDKMIDTDGSTLWDIPFKEDDSLGEQNRNTQPVVYYTDRLKEGRNGFVDNGNDVLSLLPWRKVKSKKDSQSSGLGDSQFLPEPRKRQIICPSGMTRMQCYDNALAFYMRLLRTMGDQK